VVTSAIEHKSALLPVQHLAHHGFEIITLPVDRSGQVSPALAATVINSDTLLVSLQAANNEIGTLQPLAAIADLAHEHGAWVHTDAVQLAGKVAFDVTTLGADSLALSAHKFYGPKGVGALYLADRGRGFALSPLNLGGGQEGGLRSGTANVPGIVGMGVACDLARAALPAEGMRIADLRDRLEAVLSAAIPGLVINGLQAPRLPNTSSLTIPGIDADALLLNLPQVMISTGSACNSGAIEPSHVLTALGLERSAAQATVRISLGRFTSMAEIKTASEELLFVWQKQSASRS
jgi:cysteine desulfurase